MSTQAQVPTHMQNHMHTYTWKQKTRNKKVVIDCVPSYSSSFKSVGSFCFALAFAWGFCLWCLGLNLRPYTLPLSYIVSPEMWDVNSKSHDSNLHVHLTVLQRLPGVYYIDSFLPNILLSTFVSKSTPWLLNTLQNVEEELFNASNLLFPSRKEFLRQRRAAVTIQAAWKGHCQRKNFELVRESLGRWAFGGSRWLTHERPVIHDCFPELELPGRKCSIANWHRIQIFKPPDTSPPPIFSPTWSLSLHLRQGGAQNFGHPQSWTVLLASLPPVWSQ